MTSILFRISSISLFSVAGIGILTGLGVQAIRSRQSLMEQWQISSHILDEAQSLPGSRFKKEKLSALQKTRATLTPPYRAEALSNVLQAYSEQNQRLLKQRVDFMSTAEIEFRRYARTQIHFYDEQSVYFFGIAATLALACIFFLFGYVRSTVLSPIKGLSAKMLDFLHQKYTYQFTVPAPNEVGHLEATFNSLAQRVLATMEDLKSLDRAKSEFLSIASHELRTPLTSIKGSLSLLNSGVVGQFPETVTNLLTIAEKESDRLIRLINDLLDLAKMESGHLPLKLDWISLSSLLESTAESLLGLAQTAQVEIAVADGPPFEGHMDRDRVQQVITNLLSNAIKFSPPQSQIRLSASVTDNDQLCIEVTDQGRGIAPEDQELIFERFRQATGPDNPLVKGTGLGLAIAKALVEEHGGRIGVRSTPGKGSTFYFELPHWRYSNSSAELRRVA